MFAEELGHGGQRGCRCKQGGRLAGHGESPQDLYTKLFSGFGVSDDFILKRQDLVGVFPRSHAIVVRFWTPSPRIADDVLVADGTLLATASPSSANEFAQWSERNVVIVPREKIMLVWQD